MPGADVRVDNDASESATVLEVRAPDEVGLLHRITRVLFEANLDVVSARVSTLGELVVDAFYVREAIGEKVTDPDRLTQITAAIWASAAGLSSTHESPLVASPRAHGASGKHCARSEDRSTSGARACGSSAGRRRGPGASPQPASSWSPAATTPPASATTAAPPALLTRGAARRPTGANVDGGATISVQFSTDLAPGSPMPTLSPAVAGQWAVAVPLAPAVSSDGAAGARARVETITVPGGRATASSARAAST